VRSVGHFVDIGGIVNHHCSNTLFIIVEQELLTLLEYLSSIMVFSEVCVAQSLVVCVVFCLSLFVFSEVCVAQSLVLCVVFCQSLFVFFPLAIVLSVLPFMASDYPFGIFKLFLQNQIVMI
jgi:hypothetical protein